MRHLVSRAGLSAWHITRNCIHARFSGQRCTKKVRLNAIGCVSALAYLQPVKNVCYSECPHSCWDDLTPWCQACHVHLS